MSKSTLTTSNGLLSYAYELQSTEQKNRVINGMAWVGLFSDEPVTPRDNPLDTLCATLEQKMQFEEGERDFVVSLQCPCRPLTPDPYLPSTVPVLSTLDFRL